MLAVELALAVGVISILMQEAGPAFDLRHKMQVGTLAVFVLTLKADLGFYQWIR